MRTWILPLLFAGAAFGADWKAMLAPGPVISAHTETAGNCDACHSAFDGIPDERCLSCHETIAGRISSETGWHAAVADQPCISCHTDHHGSEATGDQGSGFQGIRPRRDGLSAGRWPLGPGLLGVPRGSPR